MPPSNMVLTSGLAEYLVKIIIFLNVQTILLNTNKK